MTSSARYLFTLLILCMACLPLRAQRHGVKYVKTSRYSQDLYSPKQLSRIDISAWKPDPNQNRSYHFDKSIQYNDSGKAYKLDLRATDELQDFSLWYNVYDVGSIRIFHHRYDTIRHTRFDITLERDPEQRIIGSFTVEGGSEISDSVDEEFTERYTLSQEVIDYYIRCAKLHMDTVDLQVIPPWPDTESCTRLEFAEFKSHQMHHSGDTLISYHYTTTTENGITRTDTTLTRILRTKHAIVPGITAEIDLFQNDQVLHYNEVHYTDRMDSSFQRSYWILSGDTTKIMTMQTVLKADTLYYKIKITKHAHAAAQDASEPVDREIYCRRDKNFQLIDALIIAKTVQGRNQRQLIFIDLQKNYPAWYERLASKQQILAYQEVKGLMQNISEQKPLVRLPVPSIPKHVKRRNARHDRRYSKAPKIHYGSWKTTKRLEIDRKRGYEKRVQKDDPNSIIEVFYE